MSRLYRAAAFSAASGRLECEYCGSSYDVKEIEALYAGQDTAAGEPQRREAAEAIPETEWDLSGLEDVCVFSFECTVGAEVSAIVRTAAFQIGSSLFSVRDGCEVPTSVSSVTAPEGLKVTGIEWSPADSTFQKGTAYTVTIGFQVDDAHLLASDFLEKGTVTINGKRATLSRPEVSGGAKVKFTNAIYASYRFPTVWS